MPLFKTVNVLDVPFINATEADFLTVLKDRISGHQNTFVVTANPEIVMYAQTHPEYLSLLQQADFVTPDGIGIIKGAEMLHTPLPERITGYDTMTHLLQWGNAQHKSVYMVGAKPEVIADVADQLAVQFPNLTVLGIHDGYFNDFAPIAADIRDKQPDMVFLAVGFPKQEQLIDQYRQASSGLWMGVGGSFDVLGQHIKRAPEFFQRHHLEWFYRLITNPSRLKRMMVLPKYLLEVRKHRH